MGQRFWEIDFLRGIAIIMMILFHILFDLNYFGFFPINVQTGFWRYFAFVTASLFIFLSGTSLTVSNNNSIVSSSSYSRKNKWKAQTVRGAKIFGLGMLVTVATWLFLGSGFIVFGILHLIGFSVIFGIVFIRFKKLNLLFASIILVLGFYLQQISFDFMWLVWLGLKPIGFYSVDYFPVLPWFGVFLLGMFFGNRFYPKGKRSFWIPEVRNILVRKLCFLGRHSLIIYLLHQIIIVGILYLMSSFI